MPLPAPDLDDRRFQDLVDEAKRRIQLRCPEWTDHNVSDPGVTLVELFAWMTEQVVYRVNRVPDRLYTTFLDLLGVTTFPPTAATVEQTFWLSVAQPAEVVVPAGTQVSTPYELGRESIVFTTVEDLLLPSASRKEVRTVDAEGRGSDRRLALLRGDEVPCFSARPQDGDALLIGLSAPAPRCVVRLDIDCEVAGVGVDPEDPPLVWEAWTDERWKECEVHEDATGGLNRPGPVLLHVPEGHRTSKQGEQRAAWVRARVYQHRPDQAEYKASPRLRSVEASVVGGTVPAVHADRVLDEVLGESTGASGQRFALLRTPVVPSDRPLVVEVSEELEGGAAGWVDWHAVSDFGDSDPEDRHVVLDPRTGEITLGPAVREPDGSLRQLGRVPSAGAVLRVREYRTGGGVTGNVAPDTLVELTSSVPYVSAVTNRYSATGGRDAEDVEQAKVRGPVVLRHRGRAVTAEDFEHLARAAAPEVARVRAVAAEDGADAGGVRVLVVPAVAARDGRLEFGDLVPAPATLEKVRSALDAVRVLGTRLVVQPPKYMGVTVVAQVRARRGAAAREVEAAALRALFGWFDPVAGGPGGGGWPFGRTVHVGEVYGLLQRVPGVDLVEDARLFAADPTDGDRGAAAQQLDLDPHSLVFSYEHQVRVVTS